MAQNGHSKQGVRASQVVGHHEMAAGHRHVVPRPGGAAALPFHRHAARDQPASEDVAAHRPHDMEMPVRSMGYHENP